MKVRTISLLFVLALTVLLQGCMHLFVKPTLTHEFDTFVVMNTSRNLLESSNVGRTEISRTFYRHYEDEFDLLVILYNVPSELEPSKSRNSSGWFTLVRNSVLGDGVRTFDRGRHYGSPSRLKGIISLFSNEFIMQGPLLHEIMHLWVLDTEIIPTSVRAHWGFSSVNGQLGGFNGEELVDLGNGLFEVSSTFDIHGNWGVARPYAPLEMYLAGWLPADEVPDILVAEDATFWLEQEDGSRVTHQYAFRPKFAASGISTWSISRIIERIGERVPSVDESQKSFRMATIVIESNEFPLTPDDVKLLNAQLDLFTRRESVKELKESGGFYNFWDATRGLATIDAELKSARRTTKTAASGNSLSSSAQVVARNDS